MLVDLGQFTVTSIKNIRKAIEANKLVVFVGAGVSINSGCPSWEDVVFKLASDLGINPEQKNAQGYLSFSNDEFLKIPQYYFNERKENEYFTKVKSIFKDNFSPNPIHKLIFSLNPKHIITTNYDNLLEQCVSELKLDNEFCKVACDAELAIAPASKFIIKMHGELIHSHKNFVLKESDYDSYSNNFKLIETFVKGLIATHTLLFIGFSANDSNVRKIFQWIRDIIGDRNKPAYLLDVSYDKKYLDESQLIKFNYLKNQGIFTLFYNQLNITYDIKNNYNDECNNLSDIGKNLYIFLKVILNKELYSRDSKYIEKWYDQLKKLESFYLNTTVLNLIFRTNIIKRLEGIRFPGESKDSKYDEFRLKIFFNIEKSEQINNLKLLKNNTLIDASICKSIDDYFKFSSDEKKANNLISLLNPIQHKYKCNEMEVKMLLYIYNKIEEVKKCNSEYKDETLDFLCFDYSKISEFYKSNSQQSSTLLEELFFFYIMKEYSKAFELLSSLNVSTILKNNPILYYLIEEYVKTLAFNSKYNSYGIVYNNLRTDKYKHDYNDFVDRSLSIDLDFILNNNIPNSYKTFVRAFSCDDINSKFPEIYTKIRFLSDYKNGVKNNVLGFNSFIQEVESLLKENLNFLVCNHLILISFPETHTFFLQIIRAFFTSYSTNDLYKGNNSFTVNKIHFFDYSLLLVMVNFLSNKELTNLFQEFSVSEINIGPIDKSHTTKEQLIKAYNNLLVIANEHESFNFMEKLTNFFSIFSLIKGLTKEELTVIIKSYIDFSECSVKRSGYSYYALVTGYWRIFNILIHKLFSGFYGDAIVPIKLLETILYKTSLSFLEVLKISDNFLLPVYLDCLNIISKTDNSYRIKDMVIVDLLLNNKYGINYDEYLILLYKYLDDSYQTKLKNYFMSKYKDISSDNCFYLYKAIDNKILSFSSNIENSLYLLISDCVDQINSNNSFEHRLSNQLLNLLCSLINFSSFINNKRKAKRILEKVQQSLVTSEDNNLPDDFSEIIRILKIIYKPASVNFNETKIKDYMFLSDSQIKNLIRTKKYFKAIQKVFVTENSKSISNNFRDRYFKICNILFD